MDLCAVRCPPTAYRISHGQPVCCRSPVCAIYSEKQTRLLLGSHLELCLSRRLRCGRLLSRIHIHRLYLCGQGRVDCSSMPASPYRCRVLISLARCWVAACCKV